MCIRDSALTLPFDTDTPNNTPAQHQLARAHTRTVSFLFFLVPPLSHQPACNGSIVYASPAEGRLFLKQASNSTTKILKLNRETVVTSFVVVPCCTAPKVELVLQRAIIHVVVYSPHRLCNCVVPNDKWFWR